MERTGFHHPQADWSQVSVEDTVSELAEHLHEYPRVSNGPYQYYIYTLPIGAIIRLHDLCYSFYADETQVYLSFEINDSEIALQKLNTCLFDIRTWIIKNKFKVNDEMTEFLFIASLAQPSFTFSSHGYFNTLKTS